jgi:hypothetical protein
MILAFVLARVEPSLAITAGECQGLELLTYEPDPAGTRVLVEASCRTGAEALLPWFDAPNRSLPAHLEEGPPGGAVQFEQQSLEEIDTQIERLTPKLEIRPMR